MLLENPALELPGQVTRPGYWLLAPDKVQRLADVVAQRVPTIPCWALLATLAFAAGRLPLLVSEGTGVGHVLARQVIGTGGRSLLLLLTLLASPVLYTIIDDMYCWVRTKMPLARTTGETGQGELEVDS